MSNKFLSQNSQSDQQTPIVLYLNDKLKFLEVENNELKKEINSKSNDKEKIDYYLRLRKDMLEQIESLKSTNLSKDIHYNNEIDKLNGKFLFYPETVTKMSERLNERKFDEENNSPIKYFEKETKSLNDINRQSIETKSKLNKSAKLTTIDKKNKTKYFQNLVENNENLYSFDEFKLSQNLQTQELLFQQNENNINLRNNEEEKTHYNSAYVSVISDLEEKINDYNNVLKSRDEEIINLKSEVVTLRSFSIDSKECLSKEVENWKQKYLSLLAFKKTISEEFSDFHRKSDANSRKENDKNTYSFQKKVLHLEKLCLKYESDLESLSLQHTNNDSQKQLENENLKFNVTKIIENYDQINKTYEDNIKSLTGQIDNFKQLYITREGEFIELTDYYCKAIEEYSKPLQTLGKKERLFELEELYNRQSKELEELKRNLDNYIRENTKLRNEIIEGKPTIRAKISDAMRDYENTLKDINTNHGNIKTKLIYLEKFVTYFDEQFKFFNSVLEEKKKLEEYVLNLECEIKMMDINSKEENILLLKEQNIKLTKELEIKTNLVKEYEIILSTNNSLSSTINDKKRVKEVSTDILTKLNTEISILTNQVVSLNKTKESIEKFYKTELKNCLDKIKDKSDKIDDLQNVINKLQHDFSAKKETIFNLWLLEFKEFKENLLTMNEIKQVIQKFHIEGEELKINCDRIYSEELLMLRDEMKIKDNLIKDLKKNSEDEKKSLNSLIESYKSTVSVKQNTYDSLIYQKQLELQALHNEKQALIQIENKKQDLIIKEQKSWSEQKELLNTLVVTQFESKDKEISLLKNHVEICQKELNNTKENYQRDIDNVLKSVESQLILVKDRELFTVSQLVELEDRYNNLKQEKERMTSLLKDELEDLKGQNRVLSKLKTENGVNSISPLKSTNVSDYKK